MQQIISGRMFQLEIKSIIATFCCIFFLNYHALLFIELITQAIVISVSKNSQSSKVLGFFKCWQCYSIFKSIVKVSYLKRRKRRK